MTIIECVKRDYTYHLSHLEDNAPSITSVRKQIFQYLGLSEETPQHQYLHDIGIGI